MIKAYLTERIRGGVAKLYWLQEEDYDKPNYVPIARLSW